MSTKTARFLIVAILGAMILAPAALAQDPSPENPPDVPPDPALFEERQEQLVDVAERARDKIADISLGKERTQEVIKVVNNIIQRFGYFGSPPEAPAGPGPEPSGSSAGEGDVISDIQLALDGSYAVSELDDLDADGRDWRGSAYLTARFVNYLDIGLGFSYSEFKVDEPLANINNEVASVNLFVAKEINDYLAIGAFIDYSDVESESIIRNTVGGVGVTSDVDDERWGAGIMATAGTEWSGVNVGFTTVFAGMDQGSLGDVFDSEAITWTNSLDVGTQLTDWLYGDIYATYLSKIDGDDDDADNGYWVTGIGLSATLDEMIEVGIGYEKVFKYNDYDEDRFNASLLVTF